MSIAINACKCPVACVRPAKGPARAASTRPKLRQEGLSDSDRNFAIAMHLSPFAGAIFFLFVFTPAVLWLICKDRSSFADDHGREVLNMQLSALLLSIILTVAGFLTFGLSWLALIAWHIVIIIAQIRGAVAASNGEYFRYPMIIRFIS
jgi:uncharacterized Tic20 family protein